MSTSKSRNDTVLPQRARARVQREVLNLLKNAPEGIKLIVDPETGLPPSLNEIVVSYSFACRGNKTIAGTYLPSSTNGSWVTAWIRVLASIALNNNCDTFENPLESKRWKPLIYYHFFLNHAFFHISLSHSLSLLSRLRLKGPREPLMLGNSFNWS